MKNLVVKTLKILPLMLGSFGLILPVVTANELSSLPPEVLPKNNSSETTLSTSEVAPTTSEVLQQIQRVRQPKGFQVTNNELSQVTDVNQLRDVEPTAWAYEALKSLVERYGCIVGYPDRTFRGNRALSRWEFAAGLNACK